MYQLYITIIKHIYITDSHDNIPLTYSINETYAIDLINGLLHEYTILP